MPACPPDRQRIRYVARNGGTREPDLEKLVLGRVGFHGCLDHSQNIGAGSLDTRHRCR